MYWVPDKTGRFEKRPHYQQEELDRECERLVSSFLLSIRGSIEYPISTEDLTRMVESAARLDQFADLTSDDKKETWGLSEFTPGTAPIVKISSRLSSDPRYENPFRTTLTHEYAHVKFHGALFELKAGSGHLFEQPTEQTHRCNREEVESPREYDWAEWQAAYCSGALLMPKSAVSKTVSALSKRLELSTVVQAEGSSAAGEFITAVKRGFAVSSAAAEVRLVKLGFIRPRTGQKNLLT